MKKIMMLAVAALMATMSVNAQEKGSWDFRSRLTGNMSTITNSDDAESRIGFGVNVGYEYHLTDKIGLGLDINNDILGCKSKSTSKNLKLDYWGFAPMVRYYVQPWLMLEAGPQISFLSKAELDDENIKSQFEKTEFSVPLGIAYEPLLNDKGLRLSIGLRYRLGLSKINKEGDAERNSAFMITAGVAGW